MAPKLNIAQICAVFVCVVRLNYSVPKLNVCMYMCIEYLLFSEILHGGCVSCQSIESCRKLQKQSGQFLVYLCSTLPTLAILL